MAASRRYRLAPAAERDLADIWRYTARRWSIEQAESYHAQLVATFEALVRSSRAFHVLMESKHGL